MYERLYHGMFNNLKIINHKNASIIPLLAVLLGVTTGGGDRTVQIQLFCPNLAFVCFMLFIF